MSPPPAIALEVWGNDVDRVVATARTAEVLGFGALYYGESPHGLNLETWTVLAALAVHTTTLRLGPVITNLLPAWRSFPLLVRQMHTVAVLSGGRLDFRTGTGADRRCAQPWWAPAGVDYPRRAVRREILAEWLAAYHHVWDAPDARRPGDGGRAGDPAAPPTPFRGRYVTFDALPLDPPVARPPVTVAAMGPAAMAIAARHADVWEASHRTPDEFRRLDERFAEIAGPTGRPVRRSLEVDAVLAPTGPERRTAEQRFLAERGPDGPEFLSRALTGPPAAVTERLVAYREAGVDQLVVACVDPFDRGALEVLAEAVTAARAAVGSPGGSSGAEGP